LPSIDPNTRPAFVLAAERINDTTRSGTGGLVKSESLSASAIRTTAIDPERPEPDAAGEVHASCTASA